MSGLSSLSDYEMTNFDDYEVMQSGTWDKGRGAVRRTQGPVLTTIAAGSVSGKPGLCWCGQESGHTWPDVDKGAPHPR